MKASGFALSKLQGLLSEIQKWNGSAKTYFVGDEHGNVSAYEEGALCLKDRKGLTWFVNIFDVAEEVKLRLASQPRPARGKAIRSA